MISSDPFDFFLAWFRGEERPEWVRYLNGGARANLKQGLRYLLATADSWYRPARVCGGAARVLGQALRRTAGACRLFPIRGSLFRIATELARP